MNQLQYETSPYLLQHANNPVNWYAWKPEAFERAIKEDKPILLSIGYSTCHWCHVMERESFEDSTTASIMNEHFINIKVDREERPDLDQIYMDACQILHGNGGWPLNCFLLPDGRPFFAGTYYPLVESNGRASWKQMLDTMHRAYRHRRSDAIDQATRLMGKIQSGNRVFREHELFIEDGAEVPSLPLSLPTSIHHSLVARFDADNGGFGRAPKFPATMSLQFLLEHYHFTGNRTSLEQVCFSAKRMIRGGIFDQLGGGFARYSVDEAWRIPHFEKMLYDNALLVKLLADLYRTAPDEELAFAIRKTLGFIEQEMTSPQGGFYSALDADTEGEEGKFYVWSVEEIQEILQDRAPLFCKIYDVRPEGNWEGTNILYKPKADSHTCREIGKTLEQFHLELEEARILLLERRDNRTRPGLDDKILLSWNALCISAYCHAFWALSDKAYKEQALTAIRFINRNMVAPDGRLWHTFKDGKAQYQGFLDDYSFWINALLDAYSLEFNPEFIDQAVTFTEVVLANFLDESDKLFYFTATTQRDVPIRRKEIYDNAIPSGNAMMVSNLLRLAMLTGRQKWRRLALEMLHPMQNSLVKYPTAFGQWAIMAQRLSFPTKEMAIIGSQALEEGLRLQQELYPGLVLMADLEGNNAAFPLLANRAAQEDTYFYVCQDFQCQLPVRDSDKAKSLL